MNETIKKPANFRIPFIISVIIIVAIVIISFSVWNVTASENANYIKEDKAKQIALQDAGLTADDVTFTKCYLDLDTNRAEYEVEFYTDETEYDYDIDAATGSIRSKDQEVHVLSQSVAKKAASQEKASDSATAAGNAGSKESSATANAATSSSANNYIGTEKAKAAALSDAGLSAGDVTFEKAALDMEDGVKVYEIEFYKTDASTGHILEYEFTIDAKTGKIIEKSSETEPAKQSVNNSTSSTKSSTTDYDDDDNDGDDDD